jgi:hypothetical protein
MGAILPCWFHILVKRNREGRRRARSVPFIVEPVKMREASVRAMMFTLPKLKHQGLINIPGFVVHLYAQGACYSSGSFLKSAIPGDKHAKFSGRIMDGNNQLAMLTYGQFVTFNLDPGQHILTANSWLTASPVGGGHLKINLVPGQHYYVGAYLESLVVASKFRLEQRTCQEAQQDNKTTKPLKREHIKEYGLPRAVAETSFPTCSLAAP